MQCCTLLRQTNDTSTLIHKHHSVTVMRVDLQLNVTLFCVVYLCLPMVELAPAVPGDNHVLVHFHYVELYFHQHQHCTLLLKLY